MRRVLILTTVFFCMLWSITMAGARWEYLDGDTNYPFTYGHGGYFEYIDLSSCTLVKDTHDFYVMAAVMIGKTEDWQHEPRKTWTEYWYQPKDGYSAPSYYDSEKDQWVIMPKPYRQEYLHDYAWQHGYSPMIDHFHLFQYRAFKKAYQKIWGVAYGDGLDS